MVPEGGLTWRDYKEAIILFEDNIDFVYFFISRYFPQFRGDEDIYQEAMIGFWRACQTYDETKSKLLTLASTCIRNAILMELRRRKMVARLEAVSIEASIKSAEELSIADMIADPDGGPEDSGVFVKAFFDQLSERDKKILLFQVLGVTQDKASKELGMSQPYYSRNLIRIKKQYRAWQEGRHAR